MIRLRACANFSSLGAWPTTVRLDWQELCHDLRQEPETTEVLCAWHYHGCYIIHATIYTVRLDWHLSAMQ